MTLLLLLLPLTLLKLSSGKISYKKKKNKTLTSAVLEKIEGNAACLIQIIKKVLFSWQSCSCTKQQNILETFSSS